MRCAGEHPPALRVTVDGVERCKTAIQTNDVEVDDRGLVYIVRSRRA